jgi:uncharacterized membrane protein YfhO
MGNTMTKRRGIQLASFFLPVVIIIISMAISGQYPFGDKTLLIHDMNGQYHTFFVHLSDILHGRASALYSFSRALGGDMVSVAAYYLMSPFNLIFFFFDADNIYIGIILLTLLKCGATGFTMNYYLCRREDTWNTLIFSTSYALSAYFVAYGSNIMWFDGVMILPIIVLGIERLIEEDRFLTYLLALAYGVITNFYIGYMLCIFSVMYFVVYYAVISEGRRRVSPVICYAASSLIGGLLSGIVALPTLYALRGGKNQYNDMIVRDWSKTVQEKTLALNAFVGTITDTQMTSGTALIYCGVFTFMMATMYFFLGNVAIRRKIGYGLLLVVMVFSITHVATNYIWQGFSVPAGANYRFSFIYIFLVLIIASEAFAQMMRYIGRTDVQTVAVKLIPCVLLLALMFIVRREFALLGHRYIFAVNVILIITYTFLVIIMQHRQAANAVMLAIVSAELCLGILCHNYTAPVYQLGESRSDFDGYVEDMDELVDYVKQDGAFFRTVISDDAYRTPNDGFFYNLYGLDSYTSLEQEMTQYTAFELGYYRHMVLGIHYQTGSTHAAETLLGVKYMISDAEQFIGYELIAESGSYKLYKNETALPMALPADGNIVYVNNDDYDVFRYQNDIFASLSSVGEEIFERVELNVRENNDGALAICVPVEQQGTYYLQYLTADVSDLAVTVNGELLSLGENPVKNLGALSVGDSVIITCRAGADVADALDKLFVYRENEEVLAHYAADINSAGVTVEKKSESHIVAHYDNENADGGYLLFTIPFDVGWHATVDGEATAFTSAAGNFIAVPVGVGEHTVELTYIPRGLKKGAAISAVALLAMAGWLGVRRLHRRRRSAPDHDEGL